MKFTKEELKEIEKLFDIRAGLLVRDYAEFLSKIPAGQLYGKGTKELYDKIFKETLDTFTMYRTISAKCSNLETQEDK